MVLFAAAILSSAFLLFLVQPMVGKRIVPWFGGVPAVWTLCLAFFQSALFLGYAYAHLLTRLAGARAQLAIHAAAVTAALLSLPVLPSVPPQALAEADPTLAIVGVLSASVALPFLVLASTGPLVQAWFARVYPRRSPYPLYAVSNLGSLLALLAYPFALEPALSLSVTATAWSLGFALASLLVLACALAVTRKGAGDEGVPAPAGPEGRITAGRAVLWLLLPACAVVLLMGVTNTMCLDVASVPFLWILPLAVYLLTFILCFSTRRRHRRMPYLVLAVGSLVLANADAIFFPWLDARTSYRLGFVPLQIAIHTTLLFAGCMLLHGELYRLRPAPRSLTAYYLCLSAGGAFGGLFVGIAAPVLFDAYYELGTGLVLGAVLVFVAVAGDPASSLRRSGSLWRWLAAGVLTASLAGFVGWRELRTLPTLVHRERSFFGVLKVNEAGEGIQHHRTLVNGTTLHGAQFLDPAWRGMPTSYYGRATGLGLALAERPAREGLRIGVVGLGVGTLAAYGRAGDLVRFYEIDPAVVRLARDDGYFSFVRDSAARVEVVLGDARLSLTEEQAEGVRQDFDFLVVDAFSSDSIPVHLLTREAFAHYHDALADEGLLALHVSNRHFDLMSLVGRMGREVGLDNLVVTTRRTPQLQSQASRWVLLARKAGRLARLQREILARHLAFGLSPEALHMVHLDGTWLDPVAPWTDDYSDLFGLLRPVR